MVIDPEIHISYRRSVAGRRIKAVVSWIMATALRLGTTPLQKLNRLFGHAHLSSRLQHRLDGSVVVLGPAQVYGTGRVHVGKNSLIYPRVHLETQGTGEIEIGESVVISTGAHLVSMCQITIGRGTMIGEYSSIRDANHARVADIAMRAAGYTAEPIVIGNEVWIGRGVTVLQGVTIGDGATVGANAVVTRNVAAGATVGGVPARPLSAPAMNTLSRPQPMPFSVSQTAMTVPSEE